MHAKRHATPGAHVHLYTHCFVEGRALPFAGPGRQVMTTAAWPLAAVSLQVWDEKAGLPTGYGAALLAQWAIAQGKQ